jgi:hypothetical protein
MNQQVNPQQIPLIQPANQPFVKNAKKPPVIIDKKTKAQNKKNAAIKSIVNNYNKKKGVMPGAQNNQAVIVLKSAEQVFSEAVCSALKGTRSAQPFLVAVTKGSFDQFQKDVRNFVAQEWTKQDVDNYTKQMKGLGLFTKGVDIQNDFDGPHALLFAILGLENIIEDICQGINNGKITHKGVVKDQNGQEMEKDLGEDNFRQK